jgi:act minimal PKS chain-length factor (CLF/KS beta)
MLGEGGGILILEERSAAAARGAKVYAEIVGYGAAHSGPPADGWISGGLGVEEDEGLRFAIETALEDAGVAPDQIDAIVPHAAGIPSMDRGEAGALRAVFGSRLNTIPLVTLTPQIGDCLASSGGLAVAVAAMCLNEQRLPARLHGGQPPADLRAEASGSRPGALRHILVATGALGGQNAAVILRTPEGSGPN